MSGSDALGLASLIAIGLLSVALLLAVVRIVIGPTLADRVLALDLLTIETLGFVGVLTVHSGFALYLDLAIALALLGFLATIAFARYILLRAAAPAAAPNQETAP